jgi:hypothetical protein
MLTGLLKYMYSYFYEHFSCKKGLIAPRQLPSMDFLLVKMASIRRIQAQLVCRTTGKLFNVYRLQTSKSLRMVRLTLLTTAIRDAMPASAIQDHIDA